MFYATMPNCMIFKLIGKLTLYINLPISSNIKIIKDLISSTQMHCERVLIIKLL